MSGLGCLPPRKGALGGKLSFRDRRPHADENHGQEFILHSDKMTLRTAFFEFKRKICLTPFRSERKTIACDRARPASRYRTKTDRKERTCCCKTQHRRRIAAPRPRPDG